MRRSFRNNHPATKLAVNHKLQNALKDGFYISSTFIDAFDSLDLWQSLGNWQDEKVKEITISALETYIDENIVVLRDEIAETLVHRKEVITEILELYEIGRFYGCITLTFAQVDGIMKEITSNKFGFFNANQENHKSHPNRVKYLEAKIWVNYLSELSLLNIEDRNDFELFRKDDKNQLSFNRHSILHGESYQFGTKINAVKAILLLKFISDLYYANNIMTKED